MIHVNSIEHFISPWVIRFLNLNGVKAHRAQVNARTTINAPPTHPVSRVHVCYTHICTTETTTERWSWRRRRRQDNLSSIWEDRSFAILPFTWRHFIGDRGGGVNASELRPNNRQNCN